MTFKYGNFDALIKKGSAVTEDVVDTKIAEAMSAADSKYDDTKIFSNADAFPSTGITDVLYIAQDTGMQYIWNGSEYEATQRPLTEEDIRNIVF